LDRKNHRSYAGFIFTLTDAVVEIAHILDLDAMAMAAILETDLQSVVALQSGEGLLTPARKDEWWHAVGLVRLHLTLEAMNPNKDWGKHWLRQPHTVLKLRPIDVLLGSDGLRRVLDCIEPNNP
jgi:hypothetical protein